jgi:hypothetical protein
MSGTSRRKNEYSNEELTRNPLFLALMCFVLAIISSIALAPTAQTNSIIQDFSSAKEHGRDDEHLLGIADGLSNQGLFEFVLIIFVCTLIAGIGGTVWYGAKYWKYTQDQKKGVFGLGAQTSRDPVDDLDDEYDYEDYLN